MIEIESPVEIILLYVVPIHILHIAEGDESIQTTTVYLYIRTNLTNNHEIIS